MPPWSWVFNSFRNIKPEITFFFVMLRRIPPLLVIFLCLGISLSTLFLRNIVHDPGHNLIKDEGENSIDLPEIENIVLTYHERPPYYVISDTLQLTGLCGKPAAEAFRISGLPHTIQLMPHLRAFQHIKDNAGRICDIGWFKTDTRQAFARFSQPIYRDRPTRILARSDNALFKQGFRLEDILSRKDITLLLRSGYSYGTLIDEALVRLRPVSLITVGDARTMLEMVINNKADYFFVSQEEGEHLIVSSSLPKELRLYEIVDLPPGNFRHIMCSKSVSVHEIEALNQAIDRVLPAPVATMPGGDGDE